MPVGQPYPYLAIVFRLCAAVVLFVSLFLALFWTPAVLLGLFTLAYAADARAFSQVLDPRRRTALIAAAARRYRGEWLDSPPLRTW